jgi:hypothetical protein
MDAGDLEHLMSSVRARVEKLRLKRGDVLVCRDPYTAKMLSEMKFPHLSFQVPIVVAPLGVEKIPLDKLEQIVRDVRATSQIIIPAKF